MVFGVLVVQEPHNRGKCHTSNCEDVMTSESSTAGSERRVPAAAERALKEAEERRRQAAAERRAAEVGGRNGPDPVRYGDWEKGGIAADF